MLDREALAREVFQAWRDTPLERDAGIAILAKHVAAELGALEQRIRELTDRLAQLESARNE